MQKDDIVNRLEDLLAEARNASDVPTGAMNISPMSIPDVPPIGMISTERILPAPDGVKSLFASKTVWGIVSMLIGFLCQLPFVPEEARAFMQSLGTGTFSFGLFLAMLGRFLADTKIKIK